VTVAGAEDDGATRLVQRLLGDPMLRARFRSDPAGVAREEGLEDVADMFDADAGSPLETLELRESRSSLAGALMAAAVEGVGLTGHGSGALHGSGGSSASRGGHGAQLAEAASSGGKGHAPIDPHQFGLDGTGGPETPEDRALLNNHNVVLDANGIADIRGGRIDPRVVSVMTAISEDHKITISATASDHPRMTTGGSVSNHAYGRAFDIATVDGQPVGPGNATAHRVAIALSRLDPSIRPSEIGSPWAISGPAYFTDGAHQNHIHVGFDDPINPNWQPPADLAAGRSGGAAAPAGSLLAADGSAASGGSLPSAPGGGQAAASVLPDDPSAPDVSSQDADGSADSDGLASDGESDDGDIQDSDSDDGEDSDDDSEDSDDDSDSDEGDSDDSSDDDDEEDIDDGSDGGDSSDSGGGGSVDPTAGSQPAGSQGADIDPGIVGTGYPGDSASPERIAAWMASQAQKRGLPSELPLMASLVESGMKNLGGGDADSVGFFQMRVGIWNKGSYAGYPQRPELQLRWFLDNAVAVKRQRLAAGQPIDAQHYGDWIADVERPAAEYRGRYQLRLGDARGLLARANNLLDQAPAGGDQLVSGGSQASGAKATAALAWARHELGVPYVYGGESTTGFDCSGLMQWAYAKVGITLPRTSEEQILASNGKPVGRNDLRPGDLVFFRDSSGDVHHVGMSLGGDQFIEAPHTGARVRISSLKDAYYAQQFTGGRRFDHSAASAPSTNRQFLKAIDPSRQRRA
jgi:hypothetical protein